MEKTVRYNRYTVILLFAVFTFSIRLNAQLSNSDRSILKTVVIDAGHGGKDPGCHGGYANEKTVCLNIALKLGEMIKKKYPNIKVVYTRDRDVFIELNERANIANRAKADLFICIHANAASPAAYGSETYVLGLHRTESQQKVAERENSTIFMEDDKGAKYKDFDLSPDAIIARQIQLSVFLNQSISFADKLQKEFKRLGRYDRGVKQAGFLVLYKTTMPSVLIETGFLTNPNEEKFLGDMEGQQKMSSAMFTAFEQYKNELEGVSSKTTNSIPVETNDPFTQEQTTETNDQLNKVVFKIQIETSETQLPPTAAKFKGLTVFEYRQDNLYKYTVGSFEEDFKAANAYKNELRSTGFAHAFVVAFQNGERINLEKAIKLAQK
jgi:N-acetylmuramoyl-L-alanine amidase